MYLSLSLSLSLSRSRIETRYYLLYLSHNHRVARSLMLRHSCLGSLAQLITLVPKTTRKQAAGHI